MKKNQREKKKIESGSAVVENTETKARHITFFNLNDSHVQHIGVFHRHCLFLMLRCRSVLFCFVDSGKDGLEDLLTNTDDRNTVPKREWTQLPNHRGHLTHAQWTCQTGFQYGRHPETPAHSWHGSRALQPKGAWVKGGAPSLERLPPLVPPSETNSKTTNTKMGKVAKH